MKQTISACMVVYNEESLISRCLESIKDLVDEIIVVHDGACSDQTLSIATQYGAKIFVREHGGSCEAHRVFSFEQATSDWIFMIDADEYIQTQNISQIKEMVKSNEYDAYAYNWPIYNGKEYMRGAYANKTKTVLVRKSRMYYIAVTHEALGTYGKLQTREDIRLEHKPVHYSFTFHALYKKLFPWGRIQAKQIVCVEDMPQFNIKHLETNLHYLYYNSYRSKPVYMTIKLMVYDFWQTAIQGSLLFSSPENWKIFCIKQFTYIHLGISIIRYKHQTDSTAS